jgi:Uma2 family endonuclease
VKYNVPEDSTVSSLPLPNIFSVEEYFALERASERRFEFRDGEIVCMSGGSREHAALASNIIRNLGN